MTKKEWQVRWTDTINYLNQHFPNGGPTGRLGDHVEQVVLPGQREAISEELSLGFRFDPRDSKTAQRLALRALLLCQRVYYSPLWARTLVGVDAVPINALSDSWKTESLAFWSGKSEQDIRRGIGMFVPVAGANAATLAAVARQGPPDGIKLLPGNLTLSRNDVNARGAAETCYNGVVAWLVKSGIVSMRWVMQETSPNFEASCNRLFGLGETVWPLNTPFRPGTDATPVVPAGYIVHMWNADNGNWNGHWVVSNGDGRCCGVNNGEKNPPRDPETVLKAYTSNASLEGQWTGYAGELQRETFVEGKQVMVSFDPVRWGRAAMVRFDPLRLPNIM